MPDDMRQPDPWVQILRGDIHRLSETLASQAVILGDVREWMLGEKARREARAEEDTAIRVMPRAVDEIRRDVDQLRGEVRGLEARERAPVGIHAVAAMPGPLGWPLGWWALVASVACCLALAGGMTYGDVSDMMPVRVQMNAAPAPPTHPAHRPVPDQPTGEQL